MRQSITQILRNPVAAVGVAITTATGLLFVGLVGLQLVGLLQGAYVGILVYVMVPALFVVGLVLIPVGWLSARRRARRGEPVPAWPRIDLNDPGIRRTVGFVAAATIVNFAIVSMASYGGVQYTESEQFCGQVCHDVMEPEFVAHQSGLHGRIACVACHVGPGAQGFVESKLSGTHQLLAVLSGDYPRPIPTPITGLPSVQSSCESCHRADRFVGDVIKVIYDYANDEANTASSTTLRIHVGGPISGTGTGRGIHWHMNRANVVEFVARDAKREDIPYVRVAAPDGTVRQYFRDGVDSADVADLPLERIDCLDCHSRPAHRFASSPEREVDAALGSGQISVDIPFIRRESVRALSQEYPSREVAMGEIARAIRDGVTQAASRPVPEDALEQAIGVTQAIYRVNVFPAMKVGWGTYANQLGHVTSNGCFRCHDGSMATADGTTISSDCEICHGFE